MKEQAEYGMSGDYQEVGGLKELYKTVAIADVGWKSFYKTLHKV